MGFGIGDILRPPTWEQPDVLQTMEAWIDPALSSSNSILNAVLSPVRSFVHNVLHPVIWAGDQIINFAWSGVKWSFGRLQSVTMLAAYAIQWASDQGLSLASAYYTDALNFAAGVLTRAQAYASAGIAVATDFLRGLIRDVATYTGTLIGNLRQWASDSISWAVQSLTAGINATRSFVSAVTDSLRQWAADTVAFASSTLRRLLDDATKWLTARIDDLRHLIGDVAGYGAEAVTAGLHAFYDDVVKPIAHSLDSFLGNEWQWAMDLLGVVEDAADWIKIITLHVAGTARDIWDLTQELGAMEPADFGRYVVGGWNAAAAR